MTGGFLPIQLIYQDKTDHCHLYFAFPEEFHVTHTPNHWSNEEKSKELVTKILIPYVTKKIDDLKLRRNQEWLLISDVSKAQWMDQMKDLLLSSNGRRVPVPNNLTIVFQLLDLTVNRTCKAYLRQVQLQTSVQPENVKVDTKISTLKPLHTKWITSFYDKMQSRSDIIIKRWKKSEITNFLEREISRKGEDPFL